VHLYRINPDNYLIRNVFVRLFEAEAAMPKQVAAVVRKSLIVASQADILRGCPSAPRL